MKQGPRLPWRERWAPHELGHSLPIARGLRWWAAGLAVAALAGLLALILAIRALGHSGTEPAAGRSVEEVALDRLARVELPRWEPGAELPAVEPPELVPPPAPPLFWDPHPGDPPLGNRRAVQEALAALEEGPSVPATTVLARAAEEQPLSWLLAYGSGVAFLRTGFPDRAVAALERAHERLDAYDPRFAGRPDHHALTALTRYAEGHAALRGDCVAAVHDLKLAVRELERFVNARGAQVFDRRLPFQVSPSPLDNLDVWAALARAYLGCEGRYPQEYFERVPQASRFPDSEYSDPEGPEVEEGPFPDELAQCIRDGGTTSRCWALSNLNKLWAANRQLFEAEDVPPAFDPHRPALARLAFNVSFLAATGPDREGVSRYLQIAARLDRSSPEVALDEEVAQLGRHLAGEIQDYTALAEAYRGLGPQDMPFTAEATAEDLKGMAWALRERWQAYLADRRPGRVFEEVAEVRQVVPDTHLESLDRWEAAAREALQDALAEEIRLQKRRGNVALAAGLRDFRVGYLGAAWPERAEEAWWTPRLRFARIALVGLYLLFVGALVVVYRSVVYPYLVYTLDYYRAEMERRFRERGDLPVTGEQIYRWKRQRAGDVP